MIDLDAHVVYVTRRQRNGAGVVGSEGCSIRVGDIVLREDLRGDQAVAIFRNDVAGKGISNPGSIG